MENTHSTKYGKIKEYNGYSGEIVTLSSDKLITYYFTRNDLVDPTLELKEDDIVKFKGKAEDVFPQGYFIDKVDSTEKKSV